ncbi:hypothetical protein [Singulisphaera sp. PoT]|uniref:hypothetical protein n=1 Tax=Singulisphaera sp. PoT TaxID=3411797 RepID=UPI003BF4EDD8
MANLLRNGVFGLLSLVVGGAVFGADAPVLLRETGPLEGATRVNITLKAEGTYQPGPPPGSTKAEPTKPLALRVETRLDFGERVVKADPDGRARRSLRRVVQAATAINGQIRPSSSALRPEVALLVADLKEGTVHVFSPGGPLTRSELEVVQGPADPLLLSRLLSPKPVARGENWRVGDDAARALSGYDTLSVNGLRATLESINADTAAFRLAGEIRGSVLGGEGTINCDGTFTFDRKIERISALTVERSEVRKPGPVEAGLDVKSTLSLTRRQIPLPKALNDAVVAAVPTESNPLQEQVLLTPPGSKFSLTHDRSWHVYWDDTRQTVLRKIERGVVVSQCNLMMGPPAGKGRHLDLEQFRNDLRKALGSRFVAMLGEGEIPGDPDGGFRYKVGAKGREGEVGVIWYYYLVASPEGDQLLGTFTLAEKDSKGFGDQDVQMIGSLTWKDATKEASPKSDADGGKN